MAMRKQILHEILADVPLQRLGLVLILHERNRRQRVPQQLLRLLRAPLGVRDAAQPEARPAFCLEEAVLGADRPRLLKPRRGDLNVVAGFEEQALPDLAEVARLVGWEGSSSAECLLALLVRGEREAIRG